MPRIRSFAVVLFTMGLFLAPRSYASSAGRDLWTCDGSLGDDLTFIVHVRGNPSDANYQIEVQVRQSGEGDEPIIRTLAQVQRAVQEGHPGEIIFRGPSNEGSAEVLIDQDPSDLLAHPDGVLRLSRVHSFDDLRIPLDAQVQVNCRRFLILQQNY